MTDMTNMLEQLLSGQADQIGAKIGADPAQTQQAISAALPALLAGSSNRLLPVAGSSRRSSRTTTARSWTTSRATSTGRPTSARGPRMARDPGSRARRSAAGRAAGTRRPDRPRLLHDHALLLPLLAPIVMGMLGKQARSDVRRERGRRARRPRQHPRRSGWPRGRDGRHRRRRRIGGLGDLLGGILGGGNQNQNRSFETRRQSPRRRAERRAAHTGRRARSEHRPASRATGAGPRGARACSGGSGPDSRTGVVASERGAIEIGLVRVLVLVRARGGRSCRPAPRPSGRATRDCARARSAPGARAAGSGGGA